MDEAQIREMLRNNLAKIVTAGTKGLLPFSLCIEPYHLQEYHVSAPFVASQLIYTETVQILSFLIMDSGALVKMGKLLFPAMDRKKSLTMAISANEEVLNSASAKIGFLLGKIAANQKAVITPPMILNHSGENQTFIPCEDSLFLKMSYEDLTLNFVQIIQML